MPFDTETCGDDVAPTGDATTKLTGTALKAIVLANPSGFETVNAGPCICCNCFPAPLLAQNIFVTMTPAVCGGTFTGDKMSAPVSAPGPGGTTVVNKCWYERTAGGGYGPNWADPLCAGVGVLQSGYGAGVILKAVGSCLYVGPYCDPGESGNDPCPLAGQMAACYAGPPEWKRLTVTSWYPFAAQHKYILDAPGCDNHGAEITVDFVGDYLPISPGVVPPDPPDCPEDSGGYWWCVDKATYPYRECKQGVTEAVNVEGYPFTDGKSCIGACVQDVNWCVTWRNAVNEGSAPTGPAYVECIAGDYAIGDNFSEEYSVEGDAEVGWRRGEITDGYFIGKCPCPPCADGKAKDPGDSGWTGSGMMAAFRTPAGVVTVGGPVAAAVRPSKSRAFALPDLRPRCRFEGEVLDECKTCQAERKTVRECLHPTEDIERCTRGDITSALQMCATCAHWERRA